MWVTCPLCALRRSWRQVARSWRPEGVTSQVAFKLHKQYRQYLLAYERHLQEGCPSCPLEHSSGRGTLWGGGTSA